MSFMAGLGERCSDLLDAASLAGGTPHVTAADISPVCTTTGMAEPPSSHCGNPQAT
jgi:hypothetical protein